MPEVIVIDEIGTELEALAARTIAERGVQLIGTAHGNQIENLVKNPTLSDLVGGIQSVTLGDEEARRRGSQKSVLERKAPPTFEIAVEMLERERWVVHDQVAETVDQLLRGRQPNPQVRTVSESGKVTIVHELSYAANLDTSPRITPSPGWRASGQMVPLPSQSTSAGLATDKNYFEQLLEESLSRQDTFDQVGNKPGSDGEDLPVHVYPYAVSRHQLEQVLYTLNLPIAITKDIDSADVVLALRSHIKHHSKLRQIAKTRQIPIHTIKASSIPQIARALRRILNMDEPETSEVGLGLLSANGTEDEIEALEEARIAVERIVIPKGQPVELLPRSAGVRKMQHELVEHYHLKSGSFGEEPNRRLRIYPA